MTTKEKKELFALMDEWEKQKKSKKPEPKESGNTVWIAIILAAWFIYTLITQA